MMNLKTSEKAKIEKFNKIVGQLMKEIREENTSNSISKFANEYDFDRGNFSKIERGINSCRLVTAWKFAQACNIKLSDFAKMLEDRLGETFTLIDN